MRDTLSLSALWDETVAFVRAEAALLLPVALLGFGTPMVALLLAVPREQAEAGRLIPGPWMLWVLPAGLFMMAGSIAVSAMALHGGASVRDTLVLALRRLPMGIGLLLLHAGLQVLLALPVSLLTRIDLMVSGGPAALTALANLAVLAVMIWLYVRVMPIWALVADQRSSPWSAVRRVFALTRGRYRPLLLLRVVSAAAGVVALLVTLVPIGALFALLGAATRAGEVTGTLSYVASAAVFAGIMTIWTVYCARLYRALARLRPA